MLVNVKKYMIYFLVSDGVTTLLKKDELQSTLRIDKIKLEHSGTYICSATNDDGSDVRKINISVDGKDYSYLTICTIILFHANLIYSHAVHISIYQFVECA